MLALVTGAALLRHRVARLRARLGRASRIGLPMMVAGIFSIWLGVGGRILVGITSAADLAAYSLAFRISGLALGVHQLATTAAFPTLYAARTRQADRLLSLFMVAVLAVSVLLALAGPFVVDLFSFSALRGQDRKTFKALVPLTSFQTFSGSAMRCCNCGSTAPALPRRRSSPILVVTTAGIGAILLAARFVSNDVRFDRRADRAPFGRLFRHRLADPGEAEAAAPARRPGGFRRRRDPRRDRGDRPARLAGERPRRLGDQILDPSVQIISGGGAQPGLKIHLLRKSGQPPQLSEIGGAPFHGAGRRGMEEDLVSAPPDPHHLAPKL